MGMFDYIELECPRCKAEILSQTKNGHCFLCVYKIQEEMNFNDAVVVNGEIISCYKCKHTFQILAEVPRRVKVRVVEIKDDN
jgi:hypothetical protein